MRIVFDNASEYQAGRTYVDIIPCFAMKDTMEISGEEWNMIGGCYKAEPYKLVDGYYYTCEFFEYLKILIELKLRDNEKKGS